MYADSITESMKRAIDETGRRRSVQAEYNRVNGITPETVHKAIQGGFGEICDGDFVRIPTGDAQEIFETYEQRLERIKKLEAEMRKASLDLRFEEAAELRDQIKRLKTEALAN